MSILVAGTLKSPTGNIIAGAQITLTALTTSPDLLAGVSASAVTGDTGYYGMNVLPGAYSLTVAVNGKSQVYGNFRLDGTETTVTLNMVLRRNLVEVSIPDELLVDFRQIQNNVADDLEVMRQLEFRASGSADNAAKSAADAKVSAETAARSEASAAESEKNAEQFAQNLQDAVKAADQSSVSAALSAADAGEQATAAKSAALEAAKDAALLTAEMIREEVAEHADSTSQSALNAAGANDAAEEAASGAALSEKNAAGSALAARTSEINAADSVTKAAASVAAALASQNAAKLSETNAGQSASDAALSTTKAADAALRSGKSATDAAGHATDAQTAATNAASSATAAQQAVLDARQAATTAASDAVSSAVPEAVKLVTAAVALDANRAEVAATSAEASNTGAQKALEEAKLIAKMPGPVGPQGLPGATGPQGGPGIQGLKGDAGPAGPRGLTGPAGLPGAKGDTGPAGPAGPQGIQGITGAPGPQGLTGPAGPQGLRGLTGAQGLKGDAGTPGLPGKDGIPGLPGKDGTPGAPGGDGKDGQSAYEVWKSQQPADADTSMAAYMAIYDTVKNIDATNIGGKYVPVIYVEDVQQILDLPTGTVVEVRESTKSTEGAEDILPVPCAYLSVIANNGDPDGYMLTLHSKTDGRTWIAYKDYSSTLRWVELGQTNVIGFPVGSYVLGDFYQPEGFNFFEYPVDGTFISNMILRGHNPDLPYRLKKFPGGTWKCVTLVSGAQGLYLRIR